VDPKLRISIISEEGKRVEKTNNLQPSICLAIKIPLPPAPEIENPVRKTVNMANPFASRKTLGGILTNDLVLLPFLSFDLTWKPSRVKVRTIAAAFSHSLSSDMGQNASAPILFASLLL
jgi:hypothetical protein